MLDMSDLAEPLSPYEPEPTSPESSSLPPAQAGPGSPVRERVELRVHGVSGGQAEELLDVEPAMRVGGDRLAGFFRWRRESDTETAPGVRREIFAWGNLTSGRSSRAFWLLLLPFMLVNVAYWMRPGRMDRDPTGARRLANNAYGAGVRLLALSLTVLITLAAAGVGMDLVAWQCASGQGEECVRARPWLAFLGSPSSVLSAPGPALLVGAVLPVALIVVLWLLSRRTASDYEVVESPVPPRPSAVAPLSHEGFWRNSETMARLRSAHISAALGTVAALLVVPALRHDLGPAAEPPDGLGPWTVGAALSALLAAVVAASTLSVLVPGTDPRWNARADRICRLLRDATLVLGLAVAAYALWPRPEWTASGRLPGNGAILNALFATQAVLVLMMLVAALFLFASDRSHGGAAMRGLAGPATAALGALLGGGFSAALVYQGSLVLSGCGSLATPEVDCLPLSVPAAYSWLQLAFALEAAIALAVVGVLALRLRRDTRAHLEGVAEDYARSVRDRRTRDIAHARAAGRMTEVLPWVLAAFLLPVVALGALVLYSTLSGHPAAGADSATTAVSGAASAVPGDAREFAQGTVSGLIGVGSLLGGAALVALVWIGRSAYRDRPTRQAVGSVWDVGTFWPRAAHPLAPPSYAERAVPQLCARVALLCREDTDVVLSGHSQGSVLAAATVWQLPTDCLGRIALITHGSPLDRLYARYFPAYFGPGPFADLRERVTDWRNLWRATDAIAGPVRMLDPSGGPGAVRVVDRAGPLPDPRSYDALPGEARRPEILGHSYYTGDPAYSAELRRVLEAMEAQARREASAGSTG
jgi:hypothetical protein